MLMFFGYVLPMLITLVITGYYIYNKKEITILTIGAAVVSLIPVINIWSASISCFSMFYDHGDKVVFSFRKSAKETLWE